MSTYTAAVQSLYDARGAVYDDSWHPAFAQHLLARALSAPSPLSPIAPLFLDLACGTGLVTLPALHATGPSSQVYGIDLSPGMLSVARAKLESLSLMQQARVHLIQHDISHLAGVRELAGLEGRFDVLTCASAFVLLEAPAQAVLEWARWLRPSGRLVVDAPHPHNLRVGAIMELVALTMGRKLPYYRSWVTGEDTFRSMLEQGGLFLVEKIEFVEQAGSGLRLWDSGPEEAELRFERAIGSNAYKVLRESEGIKEQAKRLFVDEWAKGSNREGKVEDVDGVWIAVARRT